MMTRHKAIVFASFGAAAGLWWALVVHPILSAVPGLTFIDPEPTLLMTAVATLLGTGATRAFERKNGGSK